jgi:hypothetical protein
MSTEVTDILPQDADTAAIDLGAAAVELVDDPTSYQLAQAEPSGAEVVAVTLPQNAQVVVIPVHGGETIKLPTDSETGLLAEIGAEGNLGIIVDGRTIILQGYVTAQGQEPITIVTNDGDVVDIGYVIAETDPSLDIQTAAGGAAGPQGDAGVGNGIYTPFLAGPALGGVDASGVLGATALAYRLIDNRPTVDTNEVIDDDFGGADEPGEPGEPNPVAPNANPDFALAPPPAPVDFQLMLIVDISDSMAQEVTRPDGTVTTRMELQKAAISSMLDAYVTSTSGTVNVKAVSFSADAAYFGGTDIDTFVNVSDPANLAAFITQLNALQPTTNTDYDAALATAQRGIIDPSWLATDAGTQGLVYFFSDGRPTAVDAASSYPGGNAANTLNGTEENLWEGRTSSGEFTAGLADKGVVAIAVGQGVDIAGDAAALGQLGRVAYTSEAQRDNPVIVVSDENQLPIEVLKTAPATTTGNVLANDNSGPDGFGSPPILNIAAVLDVDTTSQTVAATATGFEVKTNNGVLTIDRTSGDFSYTALPGSEGKSDTFNYTIRDAIGADTDSASLTVTVGQPIVSNAGAPNAAELSVLESNVT